MWIIFFHTLKMNRISQCQYFQMICIFIGSQGDMPMILSATVHIVGNFVGNLFMINIEIWDDTMNNIDYHMYIFHVFHNIFIHLRQHWNASQSFKALISL